MFRSSRDREICGVSETSCRVRRALLRGPSARGMGMGKVAHRSLAVPTQPALTAKSRQQAFHSTTNSACAWELLSHSVPYSSCLLAYSASAKQAERYSLSISTLMVRMMERHKVLQSHDTNVWSSLRHVYEEDHKVCSRKMSQVVTFEPSGISVIWLYYRYQEERSFPAKYLREMLSSVPLCFD